MTIADSQVQPCNAITDATKIPPTITEELHDKISKREKSRVREE